ncbi:hypothetical protein swp_4898 [Shewanella piezotolerans WP3]|uniref:Uncharacterized protein n=1 Tax=Shewanella piezotolerans (strain WP3 / JCM 13877) TaxID=225849 RepID=B8CV44_SHEPW|nr:hypothetical protein swp_4898 [Shewanella piezotolerans WP3]
MFGLDQAFSRVPVQEADVAIIVRQVLLALQKP